MKKYKIIIAGIVFSILIIASFFWGELYKEQEYINSRMQQCETLVSLAINKVENQDISDQGVMKALISNIYAAYELCDDSILAEELHDLWNDLIFESDSYDAIHDTTQKKLKDILQTLKANN